MKSEVQQKTPSVSNLSVYRNNYIHGTFIDIYGDDFDTEIHAGKLFTHLYNEICYIYKVHVEINIKRFIKRLEEEYNLTEKNYLVKREQASIDNITKKDLTNSQYLIKLKDRLLIEIFNHRIIFWYSRKMPFNDIEQVVKIIQKAKKRKIYNRKFYMVAASAHSEFGFYLQDFDVKKLKINIAENYNDDFQNTHQVIEKFLKKDNTNGIVLLHGQYGTGKTTYLRHTIANINKRFIFLPLNLMDAISSPNFLPFISEYPNSILILEDCEELLVPRESSGKNSNNSLVNLLNLSDGLLSDALNIKLICTFNTALKKIDQAILRKGRLIARYEFKALETEKTKKIYKKLGVGESVEKPMTLAEIYNKDADDYSKFDSPKKLGF